MGRWSENELTRSAGNALFREKVEGGAMRLWRA